MGKGCISYSKENNIKFDREIGVPLIKGIKIVDFVIRRKICMEVSGYSYARDTEKFKNDCWYINTFTCLKDEESILKKIEFCRVLNNLNEVLEKNNQPINII